MTASDLPPAYEHSSNDIALALTAAPNGKEVLITITPPKEPPVIPSEKSNEAAKPKRAPVDFVLTIDVSGSMAGAAPVPGDNEYGGLSVLDVVKHAAKTIILTMKDDDRVSLVTFSNAATVVLPLTNTTDKGKKDAIDKVESLRPQDSTNIWDGLKASMNVLTGGPPPASPSGFVSSVRSVLNLGPSTGSSSAAPSSAATQRLSSIFLLTDGMPNVNPPRGHIPMLKMYLESLSAEATKFSINTFGFGYSLDSPLLHEIAQVGGGHFGFIPDSGMVGTVFVHAVANTYATYAGGLFVDIETDSEDVAKTMEVEGGFDIIRSSWGVQVPLGSLQYGQTRDLVVKLPRHLEKSPLTVTARCTPWNAPGEVKSTSVMNSSYVPPANATTDLNLTYNHFRLTFVSSVLDIFNKPEVAGSRYQSYTNEIQSGETSFKQLVKDIKAAFPNGKAGAAQPAVDTLDLAEDIEGQALLGVEDEAAYRKWGRHYLLSLSRSHQRQQCGNFKDPGLQPYGRDSPLFKTARDEIDKTFDDLPPPKPSVPLTSGPTHGGYASAAPGGAPRMRAMGAAPSSKKAVYSMSQYNSRAAPCFAGTSLILLADGSKVRIDALRAGSVVSTPIGSAKVAAIVKTVVEDGALELCKLGDGLTITPWHPVHLDGWKFPADVVAPRTETCEAVYSILLEKDQRSDAHAVFIGGVRCVTLGHGVVGDDTDVRSHPFLSNYDAIIDRLVNSEIDANGFRVAMGTTRDAGTSLMNGFVWAHENSFNDTTTYADDVVPIISVTA